MPLPASPSCAGHPCCSQQGTGSAPSVRGLLAGAAQPCSAGEPGFRWDYLPEALAGAALVLHGAAPSPGATCQGRTEQRGLAGEQSPETWGQRARSGGGQAWGDEQRGAGWPWSPPCLHTLPPGPALELSRTPLRGRNKDIAPGLHGRSRQLEHPTPSPSKELGLYPSSLQTPHRPPAARDTRGGRRAQHRRQPGWRQQGHPHR